VRAVEKLRVRKTGLEFLADMHLEVDAQTTVAEGHRIGHAVKDVLVQQFQALRDVLIHLEPHPHHDGRPDELPREGHPLKTSDTTHK
jgi:divalent metal cation (Fe/Co/Zn/Cd) transporter